MGKRQERGLSIALLGEPFPMAFAVVTQQKVPENRYHHFLLGEQSQQQYPVARASVSVSCSGNCSVTSSFSSRGNEVA